MQIGQVVGGRFRLEAFVGQGGMARVFRAHDLATGEPVALKVLLDAEEANRERFAREAEVLAMLKHPGIVQYVAHGTSDKHAYIAMEWLAGDPLGRRLNKPMSISDVVTVFHGICEALAVAHEHGIIHRDLAPGNIILINGDIARPKLIDFGIVRLSGGRQELTRRGALLGSMGYMAPEQARGDKTIDIRADIFALGCLMFHALTGKRLFEGGDSLAYLVRVVVEDAPRLTSLRPDAPSWLEALLARMLARSPADRPANAAALAAELTRVSSLDNDETTVDGIAEFEKTGSLGAAEQRVHCILLITPPNVPTNRTGAYINARALLDPIAQSLDGTVESLVDGHMVVTFRAARTATDEAACAARCALAFGAAIEGERAAIVAVQSSGDTFLNSTLNGLLPLLERAPADAVAVDDVTAGLLGARFDVGGDERGLFLWGERDVTEQTRLLLGKPIPFVGRDNQLADLQRLIEQTERDVTARAVIVTGEAGIGKSRLRQEIVQWLTSRNRPTDIWIGQADPIASGASFGPITRAMRRVAGLTPGEPLVVAQRKLRARIGRNVDPLRASTVTEFFAEFMGLFFDTETEDRPQLLAARRNAMMMWDSLRRSFEEFVVAECRDNTVVLILEDMHLGDISTVSLIDTVLGKRIPFVVMAFGRPELTRQLPDLWASRSPITMTLGPLSPQDSQAFVRAALGPKGKPAFVVHIAERSGGNAFFLEELIRAAVRSKDQALPDTVVAMVQGMLEQIDPRARRALRAASIIGDTFNKASLAALLGDDGRDVDVLLEKLVAAEVLDHVESSLRSNMGHGGEYAFRHAYVRETAYSMLTDEDRVLGHKLAARYLTTLGNVDDSQLAEHHARAGEPQRAIRHFTRAAAQALSGSDLSRALSLAERGKACGAVDDDLGALLVIQAEAHRWRGQNMDAIQCASQAIQALVQGSDSWCTAAYELVSCALQLGDATPLDNIVPALSEIINKQATRKPAVVIACARIATMLYMSGRREIADKMFHLAITHEAEVASKDPSVRVRVHEARVVRAFAIGDLANAVGLADELIRGLHDLGDVRSAAMHRSNQGVALNAMGAYTEAERTLRAALEAAEPLGLGRTICAIQQNLGFCLAHTGRLEEAQVLLSRSIRESILQRNRRLEAGARVYLAIAALYARKLEIADAEARAAAEAMGLAAVGIYALGALALSEIMRGKLDDAARTVERALTALETHGGTIEEGEGITRLAYAELLVARGDETGARHALAKAKERLESRANMITKPEWRRSFLEMVPEHKRTMDLAAHYRI
jgi:eukaryotic-like serine/threonine-protein kinase